MSAVMEQFTALGLEVAITELDIRMTLPSTTALLTQQESDYETVIKQCMAVENCIGITIWDYTDKVSERHALRARRVIDVLYLVLLGTFHLLWSGRCLPLGRGKPLSHYSYPAEAASQTKNSQNLEKKPAYNGIVAGF